MIKNREVLFFCCFVFFSVFYALVAAGYLWSGYMPAFGQQVYDYYYLSLIDGRMDISPRIIRFEGHYTPDGLAVIYHGVAPLVTRALLAPFVDIRSLSLAPFSIWLWSVIGTGIYHALFARYLANQVIEKNSVYLQLQFLLAIGLWLGGPGLLLVANTAMYHEPISMTYALVAAFVWLILWQHRNMPGRDMRWRLVLLALLAGLVLHARPNVAVGLYLAVGLLSLYSLYRNWRLALGPVACAGIVLGLLTAGYLGLNAMRMGSLFAVHGSFGASDIQYGETFFGLEQTDSIRAAAFEQYGRFNPLRIIPNLVIYLGDFEFSSASVLLRWIHAVIISAMVGFVRIEGPSVGVIFLWPLWFILAVLGAKRLRLALTPTTLLLAGLACSVLLTLSYGTIALRYRIDMWPMIAVLLIPGIQSFAAVPAAGGHARPQLLAIAAVILFGAFISLKAAAVYSEYFTYNIFSLPWSDAECHDIMRHKGFDQADVERLCLI